LKYKIFVTLWATFVLTLIMSSLLYTQFLNSERIQLIDGQMESYAGLLARSDLIHRDFVELDEAEEQIQEILGGYHLGLVLIIKNSQGRELYKNLNAKNLNFSPSIKQEWQFTERDGNLVRMFTKKVPESGRILQIGTFVNEQNMATLFYTKNHFYYFMVLVFVSAFLSWFLSTKLFSPLRKLAEDLNHITNQLYPSHFDSAAWDTSFQKSKSLFQFKNDEFVKLIESVQNLLTQIRLAFQMNKNHSARLAHEVNTPLSLIKNRLKELKSENNEETLLKIHEDIDRLADFVHRYLEFSESLNATKVKGDIYAIKLNNFAEHLVQTLEPLSNNRIKITANSQSTVFANHHDLEHVIQNLITNALKYSPMDRDVLLNFQEDVITIQDQGSGIPSSVMERMGAPFNFGSNSRGHKGTGLGLAWVHAIAKKYDWKLDIQTSSQGTSISIHF
jgi:signal transduction histidine kinase